MNAAALASHLVDAGLDPCERSSKAALFQQALDAIGARASAVRAWWVPGRIEFLGKHTDYTGGRSLLCATQRGFAVVAAPRTDRSVLIRDARTGEEARGELRADLEVPAGWRTYPLTVCRRVARNFPGADRGMDFAFASDLPPAAGLSSSSALVVATFLALSEANDLAARAEYRRAIAGNEALAGYLGAIENGAGFGDFAGDSGVGTQGGSQDHTAILCSRAGALVQYAFAPVRFERTVPFPAGHMLVVASSAVPAVKTGNALEQYNRAAARAAAAVRAWNVDRGGAATSLAQVIESADADGLEAALRAYPGSEFSFESLRDRVNQFRAEATEIVPAAGDALARGDLAALGALIDRSQANAERLLGNQVPETIALARAARDLGAVAASAFGAGFGGSVYALVPEGEADDFRRRLAARYLSFYPERKTDAVFFATRAGPPAAKL